MCFNKMNQISQFQRFNPDKLYYLVSNNKLWLKNNYNLLKKSLHR